MAKQPLTAWVWPVKKSHSQFLVPLACPTACYLCPGSALLVLLGDMGVSVLVPPSSLAVMWQFVNAICVFSPCTSGTVGVQRT